jgi:hypothetical protein
LAAPMKWMAPPRTPAELAERDRILKGRISVNEPTISINVGFGPDIPIFQPQISRSVREMTAQEKIDFIKKHLAPPYTLNTQSATHSNKFDPRPTFANKAVHALFPSRDDFSDDSADDDDTSEHSNLGMAADLINCEISGDSGPGCGHNCDHVQRATECLQNYARDEAMRKRNLDDASKTTHSIRFA